MWKGVDFFCKRKLPRAPRAALPYRNESTTEAALIDLPSKKKDRSIYQPPSLEQGAAGKEGNRKPQYDGKALHDIAEDYRAETGTKKTQVTLLAIQAAAELLL